MARFWLGTWRLDAPLAATGRIAEPIVAADGADILALEIVRDADSFQVLFSAANDVSAPSVLKCRVGFCNDADACNVWRARGFPLVDAVIDVQDGWLRIESPFFAADASMRYGEMLISVKGLDLDAAPRAGAEPLAGCVYEQLQLSPDPARPATRFMQSLLRWKPLRSGVTGADGVTLDIRAAEQSRSPSLVPLASGALRLHRLWCGETALPDQPDMPAAAPGAVVRAAPHVASRAETFGEPVFRFRDIEAYGFRLELPDDDPAIDTRLAQLVAPLNFHLDQAYVDRNPPTFQYQAADRVVLIELLRYGRMQLERAQPPLDETDYQSQHELVVRVLVAKADGHRAQARDSAVYVPAIFVDNPWSKIVGRGAQGYAKSMAEFCIDGNTRLRPDGRLEAGKNALPLSDVKYVNLVARVRADKPSTAQPLLEFEFPRDREFERARMRMFNKAPEISHRLKALWGEVAYPEYQFAGPRSAERVWRSLNGIQSIQVAPVDAVGDERSWIESVFTVDNLLVDSPSGGVDLTFHALRAAPNGWKQLCGLLDIAEGQSVQRNFPKGNWYHLRFSMGLRSFE